MAIECVDGQFLAEATLKQRGGILFISLSGGGVVVVVVRAASSLVTDI
jgi:hypothetical protein